MYGILFLYVSNIQIARLKYDSFSLSELYFYDLLRYKNCLRALHSFIAKTKMSKSIHVVEDVVRTFLS